MKADLAQNFGVSADNLAISSWCWGSEYYAGQFSLLDMPDKAARLGFEWLELNDFMLPPPRLSRVVRPLYRLVPYVNPELWRYRKATLVALKRSIQANGQRCLGWTMNSDFVAPAGATLARLLYRNQGVAAASYLEASFLRIILGGSDDSQPTTDTVSQLVTFLEYALNHFDGHILLENHWGLSSDIGQMLAIFHEARNHLATEHEARFRLCLDPLNMPDETRETNWQALAPWAGHVHLKSAIANPPHFITLLKQHQYSGGFTIEELTE